MCVNKKVKIWCLTACNNLIKNIVAIGRRDEIHSIIKNQSDFCRCRWQLHLLTKTISHMSFAILSYWFLYYVIRSKSVSNFQTPTSPTNKSKEPRNQVIWEFFKTAFCLYIFYYLQYNSIMLKFHLLFTELNSICVTTKSQWHKYLETSQENIPCVVCMQSVK